MKPAPARAFPVSPSQRRGAAAEDLACSYLVRRGLQIVARNVRYRVGEIDVVARDGASCVFIEVRRRKRPDDAAASIDRAKRGRIRRASQLYLLAHFGEHWPACRYDVVLVAPGTIEWLPSAFTEQEE